MKLIIFYVSSHILIFQGSISWSDKI